MSWLNQKHPKLAESVATLGKVVFTDGALSRKTKELIAVAISAVVRCEPCLESHVRQARELGASEEDSGGSGCRTYSKRYSS